METSWRTSRWVDRIQVLRRLVQCGARIRAEHQQHRETARAPEYDWELRGDWSDYWCWWSMLRVAMGLVQWCSNSDSVPKRQRGFRSRTASGQKVAHEGIRTFGCSTEYGFTRRLTGAVISVHKIFLAVCRLAEIGHQMQSPGQGEMHYEWTKR